MYEFEILKSYSKKLNIHRNNITVSHFVHYNSCIGTYYLPLSIEYRLRYQLQLKEIGMPRLKLK